MTVKWGIFLSGRRGLTKSCKETLNFYLNIWSQLYSIWKLTANVCMLTGNGVEKKKKKWWLLQESWHLFSNSFIKMESLVAYFLLFTVLHLANVSKCIKLFAKTWAFHSWSFILNAVMVWNSTAELMFTLKDACLTHLNDWSNPPKILNLSYF